MQQIILRAEPNIPNSCPERNLNSSEIIIGQTKAINKLIRNGKILRMYSFISIIHF
jgi:hypothetical protein